MRKLWVAMAVMLLLCLGSWAGADECQHLSKGGTGIGDNTYHQSYCMFCDQILDLEGHMEWCDNPGFCYKCGETGVQMTETLHNGVWKDQGYTHQDVCKLCGVALAEEKPHRSYCTSPSSCYGCYIEGVTVKEENILHGFNKYFDLGNGMHQWQCEDCHAARGEASPHVVWCKKPTNCAQCDAYVSVSEDQINHGVMKYVDLGDGTHQKQCTDCGKGYEPEEHHSDCTSPGVCVVCDATDSNMVEWHSFSLNSPIVDIDSACHYVNCEACGTLLGIYHDTYGEGGTCSGCGYEMSCDHYSASCDAPTVCSNCGATGITASRIYHPFDFIMVDDGVEHHQECSGCGEVFWTQEHYIACIAEFPAICWVCHLEIGEEAKPSRLCSEVCEDRGDTHYIKCELCGKVTEGEHEVACTNPKYCTKCKAENVSVSEELIKHGSPWVGQNTATYTDETHTYTCPDCGETVTRPHEYDKNGNDCMYCDYWRQNVYPGDADNSNGVTLTDAIAILQYCVDESVSINTTNADVTGDGKVNEQDVLRIMQYDAGWDVTLK